MAVQPRHRVPAKDGAQTDVHHLHNWYGAMFLEYRQKIDDVIGPKVNSAEKITMLRKGQGPSTVVIETRLTLSSWMQCRSHELLSWLLRGQ